MIASPELRAAFKARRADLAARGKAYRVASANAALCLEQARMDVARGWSRGPSTAGRIEHGSVIRSRTPQGERRTYAVAILPDDTMGAPWEEHDGHGIIREVAGRHVGRPDKRPGEVLFSADHSGATLYAYDVAATIAKARAEGWGLGPEALAVLERRAGRKPTRKMIVAEAVRLDLERCAGWVRDSWSWIGVCLIRMDRQGETAGGYATAEAAADAWAQGLRFAPGSLAAGLWGIESDSPDYHASVALELVSEANAS